jgi:hypothetical protein
VRRAEAFRHDICLSQGRPDLKIQCVASWLRKTAAEEVAGYWRDPGGWRSAEGLTTEGNTRKLVALGIISIRKGRRPKTAANPGEAESAQVGVA